LPTAAPATARTADEVPASSRRDLSMNKYVPIALLAALLVAAGAPAQTPAPPPPPAGAPLVVAPAEGSSMDAVIDWAKSLQIPGGDGQFWLDVDYLLGWVQGAPSPPLLTASPSNTPQSSAGVLGQNTTHVVYGQNSVNNETRSGVRFELGYWFCEE